MQYRGARKINAVAYCAHRRLTQASSCPSRDVALAWYGLVNRHSRRWGCRDGRASFIVTSMACEVELAGVGLSVSPPALFIVAVTDFGRPARDAAALRHPAPYCIV